MKKTSTWIIASIITLIIWSGILTYTKLPDISEYSATNIATISSLVIQTEDRRFKSHIGIDLYAMLRAWYYNLVHGQVVQWWSTISQQLLKHYWWHHSRTWQHKIQEIWWAVILTILNSKLWIMNYYLDHVPFPNGGVFWYASACEYYFDKKCEQLFESDILFLIAIAQDGSNPYHQSNFDRIRALRDQLCYKTDLDCNAISKLSPQSVHELSRHSDRLDPRARITLQDYPSSIFDRSLTDRVDSLIQTNRALLEQHQVHDCCIVVIWPDWEIISYNQCRAYDERVGTIDLCRRPRQTGSAIKPFIYALAFATFGYSSGTTIEDEPVSFNLWDGSLYEPKNFDNQYHGTVTLAQALGNSFNIPAIKLTHQLGVAVVINWINQLRQQYGQNTAWLESDKLLFTPQQLGLSVWLWTYETSPLEFARLWGFRYDSSPVSPLTRISIPLEGIGGGRPEGLIPNTSNIKQEIVSILSNPLNRVISFGQDNLLNRSWWFVKTGTSRKFVDWRSCGGRVDRELIVCVRVWNHDVSSMDSSSVDTAGYLRYLVTQQLDNKW